MPTAAAAYLFLLLPFIFFSASVSSDNRRILHQPLDSFPLSQSPVPSPPVAPTTPDYPFSSSTPTTPPNDSPFFPESPSPPSPASFASFPANISSLTVPQTSKPKSASPKLVAAAVAAVVAAVIVVAIAVTLKMRKRSSSSSSESKTERSDASNNPAVIPKLRRPSQPSSEFLYLGTMVNSHGGIEPPRNQVNSPATSAATSRKLESPELQPLPPLLRRQNYVVEAGSGRVEEDEEFYSPRGSSLGGREGSIGTGSVSRRVENFGGSNYYLSSSSSSSSSGSGSDSGSPRRSVSLSISPPVSSGPKSSWPKSPELVAVAHPQPPLIVEQSSSSSPGKSIDSSPRSSHVWDQNIDSPARIYSPCLHSPARISSPVIDSLPGINSPIMESPGRASSPVMESPPRRFNNPIMESAERASTLVMESLPRRINCPIMESPELASSPLMESPPRRINSPIMESLERASTLVMESLPRRINSPIMESSELASSPLMESPPRRINSPIIESPERASSLVMESSPRRINSPLMESPERASALVMESPPRRINSPIMESPERTSSPVMESPPRINCPIMESPERASSSLMESLPRRINSPIMESPERASIDLMESPPRRINSPIMESPERASTLVMESPPRRINSPIMESLERPSSPIMESPPRISSPVIGSPARISSLAVDSPTIISSTDIDSLPIINIPVIASPARISSPIVESPSRINSSGMESPERISSPVMESPVGINNPVPVPHISIPSRLPPPPPPPPPSKHWESPRTPNPQPKKLISEPPVLVNPLRPIAIENPTLISPIQLPSHLEPAKMDSDTAESCSSENVEKNEETPKPKLKPLHWDKVRASSDREMVWDQLKSSSFKLNEEMIETLFVVKTPTYPKETVQRPTLPSLSQENRVLDPKKSQNIAISLRALNVTTEEVCDALLEGNADTLGTELLESLMKMAPTKEEERKLKEYTDDSPFKLGPAEKFLKAVCDVPFAFKRVDAMLYISNFESEVDYLQKSFETLEAACEELRSSRMFLKLLEAVLKTGNRMNVGTNRGDAHAFKLDTLLKLVDIKGADGRTTLLHFVVQEIIKSEGARLSNANQYEMPIAPDDAKCRKLGLQVVSSLSSELTNVKKAAAMDSEVLHGDVLKLSKGTLNITEVVQLNEAMVLLDESNGKKFSESMKRFTKMAEEEIIKLQALESVAMSLVKEITEYFHGNSAKEEAHPFRIFMVVRDFLMILERVCKEVGMINERTIVSSAHKFPVPINPMQFPVPVNPMLQPMAGLFPGRQQCSSSDEESS